MVQKKISVLLFTMFLFLGAINYSSPLVGAEGDKDEGTNLPESEEIVYDVNKNLSPEEVEVRVTEIETKYEVGEPFSNADAEFVVRYITPSPSGTTGFGDLVASDGSGSSNYTTQAYVGRYKGTNSKGFMKGKTSNGVTVNFYGNVKSHINALSPSGQWYSGNTTAYITSGKTKVLKMRTVVSQSAYGFIGNSGTYVGLVHSSSLTSTSAKGVTKNYLDQTKKYSALLVGYTHTTARIEVTTPTGTFNLYGL